MSPLKPKPLQPVFEKGMGVLATPDDDDGPVLFAEDDWGPKRSPPSVVGMSSTPFPVLALVPFTGGANSPGLGDVGAKTDKGKRPTRVEGSQSRDFGKQLSAFATGSGWRSYTDYIGARVFYDGYTAATLQNLLASERINDKIRELSRARLESLHLPPGVDKGKKLLDLEKQLRDQAHEMAVTLIARLDSKPFLRFFAYTVNNILVRLYHQGIHVNVPQYAAFREVAVMAAKKKQSLLLLPCHKSHIDYLTISWLFYRLGLALPHIVAGENLNLPILGNMLQKCGAFFIRRSFGDDALYPVVVKEYIEQLLEQGHNIECFIEGGRSRTGKLLPPKLGILKYVVEALQSGRTEDVWICPISVQYDKVIETESYINELLGNPKEKESLTGLLLNTRVIQLKLGRIDVRFQKPFSLKGYLDEQVIKRRAKNEGRPPPDPKKEQVVLLKALGYQVLSDINAVSVIMPAALVGSVLLTIRGRGVGRGELIKRVGWLRKAIEARGGSVAEFAGMEIEAVVDRALVVLQDLIGVHRDLIEPTFFPISRFELSFYRNQIMHLFVSESMLAATLYTHVKAGGAAPSQRMERSEIFSELSFLSSLLQSEFVYGTEGLGRNMDSTIASLQRDGVIHIDEGDLIGLSSNERQIGRENFDFYCFLLWPFIEVYWLAAVSLYALTPTEPPPNPEANVAWVAEKQFQKSAQFLGKSLFSTGDVSYLEAVNQATLSNAFLRMVDIGIILTRRSTTGKKEPLMALHPAWAPRRLPNGDIAPEGKLWQFLERLGAFRREGKNRRDQKTVATRVLSYTTKIAPPVLEWSPFEGFEPPASSFWAAKPNL